jgi:fumarylacetoacetase
MINVNETHDPNLKSWIESANAPDTDFPIQNLPFCYFYLPETEKKDHFSAKIGVVIGDQILNLGECWDTKDFPYEDEYYEKAVIALLKDVYDFNTGVYTWANDFRNSFSECRTFIRRRVSEILRDTADDKTRKIVKPFLFPISDCELLVPFQIGDYTDFYCSIFHATNVGAMFRPDNPLLPNYKYIPIGYHGRASSIVISGTDIKRPKGQNRADAEKPPVFVPCKNLDYEMEVGFFVGKENNLGEPIPIAEAEKHIFGLCLVNDWSARDIQSWEYQPLGPFLAKNFATTVSPFVVTMEALAPFRVPAFERDENDPQPLDYLSDEQNEKFGGFDVNLEVYIQTEKMRTENVEPFLLSRSNMKDLYWTIGQMLTHHASNGCNLQTGDLMATGTVSGKSKEERGCMLELTWRGKEPIELPSGEQRRFLEDGDEIIMKGFCEREGYRRIGFGECRGRILPAD